jgi:hypothetical protein
MRVLRKLPSLRGTKSVRFAHTAARRVRASHRSWTISNRKWDLSSTSEQLSPGPLKRQRPESLPALTFLGLAAVPCPPRHFELEPRLPGLDRFGAVLDPRPAGLAAGHFQSAAQPPHVNKRHLPLGSWIIPVRPFALMIHVVGLPNSRITWSERGYEVSKALTDDAPSTVIKALMWLPIVSWISICLPLSAHRIDDSPASARAATGAPSSASPAIKTTLLIVVVSKVC